jgi:peroxiredoxin
MAQAPQSTEPVLINTPVPVANLAPDFTLPSIQGTEYTLSDFRGEQPVLVVFYRAYW